MEVIILLMEPGLIPHSELRRITWAIEGLLFQVVVTFR